MFSTKFTRCHGTLLPTPLPLFLQPYADIDETTAAANIDEFPPKIENSLLIHAISY